MNKAIKLSSGKYIKLLAIDDALYEAGTISKAVEYLKETNGLICVGYSEKYDIEMKEVIGIAPNDDEVTIIKNGNSIEMHKQLCISGGFIPAPSRMYTRLFFERYGLYDEDYVLLEDKPTLAKAIREGCKVYFLDETIAKHRSGGISKPGNINLKLTKDRKTFNIKEVFPYWGVSLENMKKDYIVWGTSIKYFDNKERLIVANFKYFVDADKKKHGSIIDGRRVEAPEQLLSENKDNIMLIICSSFHIEISKWLSKNGFKEGYNYINVNFVIDL